MQVLDEALQEVRVLRDSITECAKGLVALVDGLEGVESRLLEAVDVEYAVD